MPGSADVEEDAQILRNLVTLMCLILDTRIRELGPANTVFKSEYLLVNTEIQDSIRARAAQNKNHKHPSASRDGNVQHPYLQECVFRDCIEILKPFSPESQMLTSWSNKHPSVLVLSLIHI